MSKASEIKALLSTINEMIEDETNDFEKYEDFAAEFEEEYPALQAILHSIATDEDKHRELLEVLKTVVEGM